MNTATQNTPNGFLEAAWETGCHLLQEAIWHENKCTWQGYWMEPVNGTFQPVLRTFGADVYSGTSGIALFLDALYAETRDPLVLRTLEGAIGQARSVLRALPEYGFYAGKTGVAATLIRTGAHLQREDWIADGLKLLEYIPTQSIRAHETDVISGAAGTIPVLLDAYRSYNKPILLENAIALGDLLCKSAVRHQDTWSWATVPAKNNLTGFSHGASGMALALLQLHEATKAPLYLAGAQAGFAYERLSFDATQQNWPDYRDDVQPQTPGTYTCGMAWCHGAPGIAIARLKASRMIPDQALTRELHIALNTTASGTYHTLSHDLVNTNFSLCHGIAGNADILLESGVTGHRQLAMAVGSAGLHKYARNGMPWPSGLNTAQPTPGLMMGLAGTGYFYLRLHDAAKHPTLLLPGV